MQGLAAAKADGRAKKTGDHSKRKANADAKRAAKLLVATAAQAGAHDHTKEVRAGRKKCRNISRSAPERAHLLQLYVDQALAPQLVDMIQSLNATINLESETDTAYDCATYRQKKMALEKYSFRGAPLKVL